VGCQTRFARRRRGALYMSKKLQSFLQIKQSMIAYFSSAVCLLVFFLWTMLIHDYGKIGWNYLGYAVAFIVALSAVPAIIIYFTKVSQKLFASA
jgi:hypothetical protein